MSDTDPRRLPAALHAALVARGWSGAADMWQPLDGGRTNRLWRGPQQGGALVVKLFTSGNDNPLFRNDPAAEARLLRHLEGRDIGPVLLGGFGTAAGQALAYRHVPGDTWQSGVAGAARLLHRVHGTAPPGDPALPRAPDGSAALGAQGRAILAACPPVPAAELRREAPRAHVPPSAAARLLHGDPVCANIVGAPQRLRLIDWQCPAQGDPCEDLALFLSPAMHLAYRGRTLGPAEEEDFLGAYPDREVTTRYRRLAPWYHWRMAAYCLWRMSRGDSAARSGFAAERAALASLSEQS